MHAPALFVVFFLERRRYALALPIIERVVHAVDVTALPGAPPTVLGLISVEGRVLPVFSLRRRFGLPDRDIAPSDRFLIARTTRRSVVLAIDEADGVIERDPADITGTPEMIPGTSRIQGVIRLDDGLILIHDLEKFLSPDEANDLDAAIDAEVSRGV